MMPMLVNKVAAQSPVVETLYVPSTEGDFDIFGPTDYIDIPRSQKEVTIPSGTAFLTWSMGVDLYGGVAVRPVIGANLPQPGLNVRCAGPGNTSSSWTTPVLAGQQTVKLQVKIVDTGTEFRIPQENSITWTLIAFPDATGNVPAIGQVGLVVMDALLLAAGGIVVGRRRQEQGIHK